MTTTTEPGIEQRVGVFAVKFLAACEAIDRLEDKLSDIGLSTAPELDVRRKAVVNHGAVTVRDITNQEPADHE